MDIWKVIDTYFKSNEFYFTRHHLNSYNDFVLNKIPYIIDTLNPFIILKENSQFRVEVTIDKNINLCNPVYDDDHKLLYPNVARLQNRNYFCDLRSDITVTYFENNKKVQEDVFSNKKIGSIPILLHSRLCYLNGLGVDSLQELGECPYDQGGYFIVDGKEKVIISQERIATNQLFISDPSDPNLYKLEGMIRSTSLANVLFPKSVHFWVEKDTYKHNNTTIVMEKSFFVSMKVMNINLERIPVVIIFRALGIESDRDILDYIALNDTSLFAHLRSSIVNATTVLQNERLIYTQAQALKYLSNFVKYKQDVDYVKYVFINDLFPNIGNNFREKAMYLGYLVNRLVRITIGQLKQNKRDNYMYKRVDTTGILLGNIFRDFYNQYRNHVRSMIDREYTTGGLKSRLKLVSDSNFNRVFPSSIIEEGMYKSMKGNWGLTGDPSEQGIVQDVNRLSYVGYMSHVRRVNTPIDRSIKLVEPHRLDTPQWGMMCPIESPDGANIGLLKHMSASCEITLESDRESIFECLVDLDMMLLANIHPHNVHNYAKIHLNNNWIGVHKDPLTLVNTIKKYRRTGVINAFISIAWNVIENEVMIFSDSGRCCRPLIRADKYKQLDYDVKSWDELVNGYTYDYTYDKRKEKKEDCPIEYVDCFETNTLYIAMNPSDIIVDKHTHVEIHPCLSLSFYTNNIPFANHNQAPRNVFSGQQGKQALGVYATNFNHRIDTAAYVLHYPQRSLVSTKMAKYTFKNNMPNGENLIVAIATYTGYNQEDSIIVNKSSIARGMFNVSYFKSIVDSEDENLKNNTKVVFDNPVRLKKEGKNIDFKYAHWDIIDDNGMPIPNKYISENDCYLGKVNIEYKQNDNNESIFNEQNHLQYFKDKSKIADKTLSGTIDKVIRYDHNGLDQVKIKLRKFRIPELGDKMASTHGQKGVCGMVLPQEDMPYTKNGIVPDIIVNPHAFPSRMTIAHLIESVLAKLCCFKGVYVDGTPFEDHCVADYYELMKKYGYQQYGDELLYNGFTGEQIETEIFFGPTYYYRLKHMVKDKINYRSSDGPVESITRQPTQGRANGGGLRIGEMETNAILAHGISKFVKETMTTRSDGYHKYIDGETGEDIIYNEKQGFYDSLNAQKIEIPYSMKLLQQEIEGLGINMKLLTKNV